MRIVLPVVLPIAQTADLVTSALPQHGISAAGARVPYSGAWGCRDAGFGPSDVTLKPGASLLVVVTHGSLPLCSLESPLILVKEPLNVRPVDAEMLAYVWNSRRIRSVRLLRHNAPGPNARTGDDEWVGNRSSFEALHFTHEGPEVRYRENLRHERGLGRCRLKEHLLVRFDPRPYPLARE